MVMMALIDTSLEGIKFQYRTDISTHSPMHHATPRCSQHPAHLAHPHLSVFHRFATKTTTTLFLLPATKVAKTTTLSLKSTSLSLLRPTPHILAKPTALTSDEDNLVVDVLMDDMDVVMVEVRRQVEDKVTITLLNGPEMVST
jgi:hypothetical protein